MTQSAQKTLRDFLQETEDTISKGRMSDAESNCQHILAQFPESLEAQRLLGEIYLAKETLKEAQQAFDWVLTNDPENVIAYCDRALISERQGDYDTSLDCYQQAYELSRGNSKIRQEFNKLSQKAGQQGFMLSRAGLARLYMRGDLLTQAIQEWEAVLAVTPERLDARTGLLEAYWREGLYERVEQLAAQILQDVPGCEKALLLLAYVTSLKSTTQAQDLLRRVEALDPDLVMAHDLFSDLFASQPAEPFLDLLKKPPVTLSSLAAPGKNGLSVRAENVGLPDATHNGSSASTWESLQNWQVSTSSSNEIPPVMPEVPVETPMSPIWPEKQGADDLPWSAFVTGITEEPAAPAKEEKPAAPSIQKTENPQEAAVWNSSNRQEEKAMEYPQTQPEPWEALQDALSKANSEGGGLSSLSPEIWATLDQYLQTSGNHNDIKLPGRENSAPERVQPEPIKENTGPTVPAWMNSLNQPERRQKSGSLNETALPQGDWQSNGAVSSNHTARDLSPEQPDWSLSWQQAEQKSAPTAYAASSVPQEIGSPKALPVQQEKTAFLKEPADDALDEEESLFGPAWLRSLGATTLDEESMEDEQNEATSTPEVSAPSLSAPPQQNTWSSPLQSIEDSSWRDTFNQPVEEQRAAESALPPPAEEQPWMSALQPATQGQQEGSWMDALRQSSEPTWLSSLQQTDLQQTEEPSWMDALQQETEQKKNTAPHQQEATPVAEEQEFNWGNSLGSTPEIGWTSNATPFGADTNWAQSTDSMALSSSPEQADDPLLTTLRELEQGLLAQGFVPLEPNTLSSLAQAAEQPTLAEPATSLEEQRPQTNRTPSLSSALAELGGFAAQPREDEPARITEERPGYEAPSWAATMPTVPAPLPLPTETLAVKQEQIITRTPSEPVWQKAPAQPAAYNPTPTAQPAAYNPTPTTQPVYNPTPAAQPAAYSPTPAVYAANATKRPSEIQTRDESVASLSFRPTPVPAEATRAPLVHIDPLLDSELETTMKRPAIRLQPMQQHAGNTRDQKEQVNAPHVRGRTGERSVSNRGAEQGLTNQERLIAGYQHQLVGDYDDAMQEYRIIIRNSPDLLGEVISNVRALLKLAPKYAAGYRVLGDAYMRQGEYLQAMEAYNKALTIAKKKA